MGAGDLMGRASISFTLRRMATVLCKWSGLVGVLPVSGPVKRRKVRKCLRLMEQPAGGSE